MSLLDQLTDAMDAVDEYNAGKRARVWLTLGHGCLIAFAKPVGDTKVVNRRISIDMLEASVWPGTARQIVDDAVNAL